MCKSKIHTQKKELPLLLLLLLHILVLYSYCSYVMGERWNINCAVENTKMIDSGKIFSFNLFREHYAPISETAVTQEKL